MVAVRLDPYQNIVGVGWSAGKLGHLEVWMDLRTPYYATNNPSGQPNSPAHSWIEARIVSPSRDDYVLNDSRSRGTDPNNPDLTSDDWDWIEHQTSGDFHDGTDLIMEMPSQEIVDDHNMTQAGMHRIYPIGVTGGNVSDMTIGGACNFLLNWAKIATAEFFGLPADTPREEWPDLRVELYGSIEAMDGARTYTVHIQFRMLSTGEVSDLTRNDPDDWLEISYPTETTVIEESERVERSYSANYYFTGATNTTITQARQHIGTLVYRWAPDTDQDRIEIEEP